MHQLLLGPFFCPSISKAVNHVGFLPLGLQLEWAGPDSAAQIPLFRQSADRGSKSMRLEQLLFDRKELPFDLECPEYQVMRSSDGILLPLESLLAALYDRFEIYRSVSRVLSELASLVSLHHPVRRPITACGLLSPKAETAGFRLNTILREGRIIYANIAWQTQTGFSRFHACVCKFQQDENGALNDGVWQPATIPGVAPLLRRELRRLEPGAPERLFSAPGKTFLKTWHAQHNVVSRRERTAPNKKLYEKS